MTFDNCAHQLTDTVETLTDQLDQLIDQKADQYNPIKFRFIESLVKRASQQRASVRQLLESKAQLEIDNYLSAISEAQASAQKTFTKNKSTSIHLALSELIAYLAELSATEATDHKESPGLNDFDQQLQQQERSLLKQSQEQGNHSSSRVQTLKSVLAHQKIQEKKRVQNFIDNALSATPENPGPLNPEILLIKLLKSIRDLSPEYLSRYVSYIETLQRLERES